MYERVQRTRGSGIEEIEDGSNGAATLGPAWRFHQPFLTSLQEPIRVRKEELLRAC